MKSAFELPCHRQLSPALQAQAILQAYNQGEIPHSRRVLNILAYS